MASLKSTQENAPINILHVDHNASILEITKLILQDLNSSFKIDWACSVDEAFTKLSTKKYDVVVSDYEMPQKDGLEFLKQLREAKNEIPFILFTGKGREEIAIKALNLGADGYFNKQGNPETVYGELAHGIQQAVTRKKAEEMLQEREAKYSNIFNNSEVGMFRTKLDGSEILDFNDKYLSILGLNREEIKNRSSISFWADPHQREEVVCLLKAKGQVKDFECKLLNKKHEIIHGLTSVKLYPDGILEGVIIDITERKKTEKILSKTQEELNCILDSAPTIIFYKDKEGKLIQVNNAFARSLNVSKEKLLGKTIFDLYSAEIAQAMANDDKTVMESKHPKLGIEELYEAPTGLRWIRTDKIPSFDENGIVNGLIGFSEDITERKKAEEALKESEKLYRTIFDNSEDGFQLNKIIYDANGKPVDTLFLKVNSAYERQSGVKAEDIVGKTAKQFASNYEQIWVDLFAEVARTGKTKHFENYNQLTNRWYDFYVFPYSENTVGSLSRDVTERKKVEEALIRKEKELETIFDVSPTWIFYKDTKNRLISVNKALAKVMGMSKEKIEGHSISEFFTKDQSDKNYADDMQVIGSRKPKFGIIESLNIKGRVLWVRTDKIPIFDINDKIVGVIGFSTDITEQREKDLALRRKTLRFKLEDGNVYRFEEPSPLVCLEALKDLKKIGFDAVVISRAAEADFRKLIDNDSGFYWLAKKGKNHLKPNIETVEKAMETKQKNTVFLFDGLDYLSSRLNSKEVLSLVQWLKEYAVSTSNIVLLPIDSSIFSPKERKLIEKETKLLEPMLPPISTELLVILQFIYSKNKVGFNPSHSDIQLALNISRQTFGRKMKTLKNKQYVAEDKIGNRKVLHLTENALNLLQK